MRTHKHHIVPKHAGGSDHEDNLVELTVEDHAIAHKVLYGLWGRWQDNLAWKMLSGKGPGSEEARKIASREALKNYVYSDEQKEAMRQRNLGKKLDESTKLKISNSHKSRWLKLTDEERQAQISTLTYDHTGRAQSEEEKSKRSVTMRDYYRNNPYQPKECPNCGKKGKSNAMYRWHFDNCKESL